MICADIRSEEVDMVILVSPFSPQTAIPKTWLKIWKAPELLALNPKTLNPKP